VSRHGTLQVLRRRVQLLDAPDRPWASSPGTAGLIEHTTATLDAHTGDPDEAETAASAALDPADADDIVQHSAVLAEIGRQYPELAGGPLRRDAQQWIGTGRHTPPDPANFLPGTTMTPPSPKPLTVGLYTSTAGPDGRSMWRTYLDLYRGSDLYPLPWNAWDLHAHAQARVREVVTAQDWARLVEDYPLTHAGQAYPDWKAVTADHDAVHLTLTAVVAIQGLPMRTAAGPTAPAFWDIESTLWLRWSFGPPHHRYSVTGSLPAG